MLGVLFVVQPAVAACGIRFTLPHGWVMHETHPESEVCALGVTPANWQDLVKKARWPAEGDAIVIQVLNVDFKEAAERADFHIDDDGKLTAQDRGGEISVERVRYSGMSGYSSSGWFRGFANDGADLGDQSRLYSGTHNAILLRRGPKSFVLIEYDEGNPDIKVHLAAAANVILHSLRKE